MGISILICTFNEGILRVPSVLMPPMEGVKYVVCMQYTDEEALGKVPMKMLMRKDVKFYVHEGQGLCKNRNFALDWADGDICVIADDDNRYKPEYIQNIIQAYAEHPEADIITFQAETIEGKPLHPYPADYVSSVEMTFRPSSLREKGLRFNEDFGINGNKYCAGEEDVFLTEAKQKGLNILYVPKVIVQTQAATTGTNFADNPDLQRTKGAVFLIRFGKANAIWRSVKEAGFYFVHKGKNPFIIFRNMLRGINGK